MEANEVTIDNLLTQVDDRFNKEKIKTEKTELTNVNVDVISNEDSEIQAELLKEYSGAKYNNNGDIVDNDGKVIKTVEELDVILNNDIKEPTLDDKGNEVDDNGNIIKTKEELEAGLQNQTSVIDEVYKSLDYEFLDDEGKPKSYEDNEKGFTELANDLAAAKFEDFKNNFFGQNPELARVAKHILSGKSVDTYRTYTDYSQVDVAKISKEEKLDIIRNSYEKANFDKTRTERLIQLAVDSNSVDDEVKDAINQLQQYAAQEKEQQDLEYRATIEKENKQVEEYWENVENAISKGDIGFVSIPETDRTAFFDYLSTVVDNKGNSKEMLDRLKEPVEQKLALAYLRYKKFNLNELINKKASTQRLETLRNRIAKNKHIDYSSGNVTNKGKGKYNGVPTINDLLS